MTDENSKTGGRKAGRAQAAEAKDVIETDPTEGGANEEAGITTAGVGDEAVLVKSGDKVGDDLFSDAKDGDQFVTLGKDVVEEFYYPGTKRPAYRILFTKGQVVRRSAVDALNAGRGAGVGEDASAEDKLRERVDSSTLAAGTYPGVENAEGAQKKDAESK